VQDYLFAGLSTSTSADSLNILEVTFRLHSIQLKVDPVDLFSSLLAMVCKIGEEYRIHLTVHPQKTSSVV
jgi:hypothetical protein